MNMCTKFCGNPFSSFGNISLKTSTVNLTVTRDKVSGSSMSDTSSEYHECLCKILVQSVPSMHPQTCTHICWYCPVFKVRVMSRDSEKDCTRMVILWNWRNTKQMFVAFLCSFWGSFNKLNAWSVKNILLMLIFKSSCFSVVFRNPSLTSVNLIFRISSLRIRLTLSGEISLENCFYLIRLVCPYHYFVDSL